MGTSDFLRRGKKDVVVVVSVGTIGTESCRILWRKRELLAGS